MMSLCPRDSLVFLIPPLFMDHVKGIITVVDQSSEQEDKDLIALRELPRFEPLMTNEQPSHFSLANVFGTLSASGYSNQASPDTAFNANVLVDIFIQMNAHSKKCAQDIQEHQRALGLKVKALDDYTAGAVQELASIHHRAKSHSDQLLSVHALTKQAHTTATLLQGIMDKITAISDTLPADVALERPSSEIYPNLYRYLQQASHLSSESEQSLGSGSDPSRLFGPASTPSGLALLGQNSNSKARGVDVHLPSNTTPSVPKARASMALASRSMDLLSVHDGASELDGDIQGIYVANHSFEGSSPLLQVSRSTTLSSLQDQPQGDSRGQPSVQQKPQQPPPQQQQHQTTLRAFDNLLRLANKAPPNP